MIGKGIAAARVLHVAGIAHLILSTKLARAASSILFGNGTLSEVVDAAGNEGSSLFGGEKDGTNSGLVMFGLEELSGEGASQQRRHRIKQRERERRRRKRLKLQKRKSNKRPGEKPESAPPSPKPSPTEAPTKKPTAGPGPHRPADSPSCFSSATYDAIDRDIARIKDGIRDDDARGHFLGGILRLAAHDFMDYDRRDRRAPMGPDGCYDPTHPSNDGLETIWCRVCPLKVLHDRKYAHVSRADFWIVAANAVVRQTSIRQRLDLKGEFMWGRKDRDACRGSGERLPQASGCGEIESVFLRKMGLDWKDAVALMGGHTLGRGNRDFSGHHGTWVDSREAQTFDKGYYEALFVNSWRPVSTQVQALEHSFER
jgi:hypothetical protein